MKRVGRDFIFKYIGNLSRVPQQSASAKTPSALVVKRATRHPHRNTEVGQMVRDAIGNIKLVRTCEVFTGAIADPVGREVLRIEHFGRCVRVAHVENEGREMRN